MGAIETVDRRLLDFVTAVNYTGYFLCVKHAARVMKPRQSGATT